MADPLISLDTEHASAQPGGQARVTVTITNPGTVVEGYRLQVLGPAVGWAEVVPPEVSVYPQQEVTAAVVFSPPSGAQAPGGTLPFGVIARSTLDPQISAVAEGDIEIGQVYGLQAKVIPVTSSGRWRGRHVIQVSNWGNAPAQLRMGASDPDEALGFYVSPPIINLPPGGRASVRLSARTKHPFLRGTPVRLPFQVIGERLDAAAGPVPTAGYGDPSRPVVDAAFNQKPILSKGFVTFMTTLLVAVVAFAAYLYFKPPSAGETLASRGSPPKPAITVTGSTPESISLSWTPVELAESYNLQHVDPKTDGVTKVDKLDGAVNIATVSGLPPDTESCFKLTVTRGGLTGPASDKVCAKTAPAPPSPSPTPSDTPTPSVSSAPPSSSAPTPTSSVTPGDPNTDPLMKQAWIAVGTVLPKSQHVEAEARAGADDLNDAGLQGKFLDTAFYPRLQLSDATPPTTPAEPSYLVFVGPFPTQQQAEALCGPITTATGQPFCVAAQPDPL